MILTFGKHRGKRIEDCPLGYLEWMLATCRNITPELRREIRRVIESEQHQHETPLAIPALVPRWYRALAMEFHPDRGGSHEAMKAIGRAKELLCEMAEVAS